MSSSRASTESYFLQASNNTRYTAGLLILHDGWREERGRLGERERERGRERERRVRESGREGGRKEGRKEGRRVAS
jgi:hypothetical protein